MSNAPFRIGILLTAFIKGANVLKYLVLHLNTLQQSIEFQFLPVPSDDDFLNKLGSTQLIKYEDVDSEFSTFLGEYESWLQQNADDYGLAFERPVGFVLLTTAKFSDYFYHTGHEDAMIVALGHWKRHMAPPSEVEFFLNLLVASAIELVCGPMPGHQHTKGCVFDFTANLDEARLKVLTGFLCSECTDRIRQAQPGQFVDDVKLLLSRDWLGSAAEPSDVALTVKKLGHDLFYTKGVEPTLWERLRGSLEREAVGAAFRVVGAIVIAALLVWLGLRAT